MSSTANMSLSELRVLQEQQKREDEELQRRMEEAKEQEAERRCEEARAEEERKAAEAEESEGASDDGVMGLQEENEGSERRKEKGRR